MTSDDSSSPKSLRERLTFMATQSAAPASFRGAHRSRLQTEETVLVRNIRAPAVVHSHNHHQQHQQHPVTPPKTDKQQVQLEESTPLSCHTMMIDVNPFLEDDKEEFSLSNEQVSAQHHPSNDHEDDLQYNDQDDVVDNDDSDVSTLSNVSALMLPQRLLRLAYQNHLNSRIPPEQLTNAQAQAAHPLSPEEFIVMEAAAAAAAAAAAQVDVVAQADVAAPHVMEEAGKGAAAVPEQEPNNHNMPPQSQSQTMTIPREICFAAPASSRSRSRRRSKSSSGSDDDEGDDNVPDWLRLNDPPNMSNLEVPSLSPVVSSSKKKSPAAPSTSQNDVEEQQQREHDPTLVAPRRRRHRQFLVPPPPLDTSGPSPSIPRPTLGKHCQSAPMIPTRTTTASKGIAMIAGAGISSSLPFPPPSSSRQQQQRQQRPVQVSSQHRSRSDVPVSILRHQGSTASNNNPLSPSSSASCASYHSTLDLQRLLGNRERYQPAAGSSNRSTMTLSVGSLVGESSWVTGPPGVTTIATMSTSNDDKTITSHNTNTTTNHYNNKMEEGAEGDENDELDDDHAELELSPCRSKKSSITHDAKILLDRVLRKWKLHHHNSNNHNHNTVDLKRSSGCLT